MLEKLVEKLRKMGFTVKIYYDNRSLAKTINIVKNNVFSCVEINPHRTFDDYYSEYLMNTLISKWNHESNKVTLNSLTEKYGYSSYCRQDIEVTKTLATI